MKTKYFLLFGLLALVTSCSDISFTISVIGEHINSQPTTFSSGEKNRKDIKVNVDDGYTVEGDPEVTNEGGEAFYRYKDSTLVVTPLKDIDFEVKLNTVEKTYNVIFDAEDSFLNGSMFHIYNETNVPHAKLFKELSVNYTCQKDNFNFKGWSLTKGGFGELISEDYRVTSDITVYPTYTGIIVDFESDTINLTYEQLTPTDNLVAKLTLKEDKKQWYEFPLDLSAFTVKCDDEVVPNEGLSYDREHGTLTVYSKWTHGKLKISIQNYQPVYSVETTDTSHLKFEKFDDNFEFNNVKKGEDFKLKMTAFDSTSYICPSTLNIIVGDSTEPLSPISYAIVPNADAFHIATITIKGQVITGNVKVTGTAVEATTILYRVDGYGCSAEVSGGPTAPKEGFVQEGVIIKDNLVEYIFTLNPETKSGSTNYQTPKLENIHLYLDSSSNITNIAAGDDIPADKDAVYNETTGVLKIKKEKADRYINIQARCPDFSLFNALSWNKISEVVSNGRCKDYFYLGERKSFKYGGIDAEIIIIGFDQDDLSNGQGKAQMTLIVSKTVVYRPWNYGETSKNYNYFTSTIHSNLNVDFYNNLPAECRPLIKTVKKNCKVSTDNGQSYCIKNYDMKVFAPSISEVIKDSPSEEGDCYQYFLTHSPTEIEKVNSNTTNYWTRTPVESDYWNEHCYAYTIYTFSGVVYNTSVYIYQGATGAFCF